MKPSRSPKHYLKCFFFPVPSDGAEGNAQWSSASRKVPTLIFIQTKTLEIMNNNRQQKMYIISNF